MRGAQSSVRRASGSGGAAQPRARHRRSVEGLRTSDPADGGRHLVVRAFERVLQDRDLGGVHLRSPDRARRDLRGVSGAERKDRLSGGHGSIRDGHQFPDSGAHRAAQARGVERLRGPVELPACNMAGTSPMSRCSIRSRRCRRRTGLWAAASSRWRRMNRRPRSGRSRTRARAVLRVPRRTTRTLVSRCSAACAWTIPTCTPRSW